MKKRLLNLFMVLVAIMGCWSSAMAQTDVTSTYLTNADLSSIDGWTIEVDHVGESYGGTYYKLDAGLNPKCIEVYHTWAGSSSALSQTKNFKFSQTPTLPAGEYRLVVNGFYREGAQKNTTTEKAWMFAGEKTQYLVGIGTCGANSMSDASTVFRNGGCKNEFDFTVTEESAVEIGFQGYINTSLSWVILGPITLYQYSMDDFNNELLAARTKLEGIMDDLNEAMYNKAETVLAETETVAQTKADILAATEKVNAMYNEATTVMAAVENVFAFVEVCQNEMDNFNGDKETFSAAIDEAINNLEAATSAEEAEEIAEGLTSARIAYIGSVQLEEGQTVDMTWLIVNPGFDTNLDGWSCEGNAQNKARATNKTNGIITDGFFENWNPSPFTGTIYQEITGLPKGKYVVKVAAFGTGTHVYANEVQTTVTSDDGTWYEMEVMVSNGTLKFGIQNNNNVQWMGIDNASLKFAGTVNLAELQTALTAKVEEAKALLTAKMNADDLAALNTAIENAENVEETEDALTAALDGISTAIVAANNSVNAYVSTKAYLDKMATALESTNVYTKEAYDAYYGTWLTEYENNTLATETAATLNASVAYSNGWHSASNLDDIILSSWTIGGNQAHDFDQPLHLNTWSTEGDNDGTNFRAPFLEYWVGDGDVLGATNLVSTITGLEPNGNYSFTVWARVRQTNNKTKAENGITLQVGEGETVDMTVGEQIGSDPFYIGEFTAKGNADAEGKLTITIAVNEGCNISWLAFQNAKYEEAIVPVAYDFVPASTTPANGETVVGMSVFKLAFNDYVNINYEASSTIYVYDENDEVAGEGTLMPDRMAWGKGLMVGFNEPLAAGNYTIKFAQGLFGNNAWVESGYVSGNANPELTYNFTAEELVVVTEPTSFTPENEAVVESISQFEITFAHAFDRSYAIAENPVVLNADGDVVEEIGGAQVEWNSDWTVMIFKLNNTITEPGTYTFKLPAEYIALQDESYNTIGFNTEFTSTVTIETPGIMPNNIEPANGSEVGMLMKFEAKFEQSIDREWEATEMPYIKNSEDEVIATFESYNYYLNDSWDGFIFEMPQTITEPGTYTIVVPAGIVAEVDMEGNPTGIHNSEFEVTYIVTGEVDPVTFDFVPTATDPENGGTVNQLYSITLTFDEAPAVNYEAGNTVTVYNENEEVVSTGVVYGSRIPNSVSVVCDAMGEPINAGGTYTIVVAAGSFGNEAWLNSGMITGSCNPELSYTVTVVEPNLDPTVIVPDNNTTVDKIESITLTYDFAVSVSWYGKIAVKDAEGNVVAEVDGEACELIPASEDAQPWDPCYSVKVTFAEPIVAKGTYTVNIPADFFYLGEYGEFQNKETVLTYEVIDGSNINDVVAEDGNVTVYTLSGVKVIDNQAVSELKNLKKGIYIVNGKKVVIK